MALLNGGMFVMMNTSTHNTIRKAFKLMVVKYFDFIVADDDVCINETGNESHNGLCYDVRVQGVHLDPYSEMRAEVFVPKNATCATTHLVFVRIGIDSEYPKKWDHWKRKDLKGVKL